MNADIYRKGQRVAKRLDNFASTLYRGLFISVKDTLAPFTLIRKLELGGGASDGFLDLGLAGAWDIECPRTAKKQTKKKLTLKSEIENSENVWFLLRYMTLDS